MTKTPRERANEEQRATVRTELKALFRPSFSPTTGFYAKGAHVGVFVSPSQGPVKGCLNLSVLLFSSLAPAPGDWLEAQEAGTTLEICLRVLRHRRPELRVSGCQRLEQLGDPEAEQALLQLERTDPNGKVREAAAQALAKLSAPRFCEDAVAGIKLRLSQAHPPSNICESQATTDERGYAEFHQVHDNSPCTLEVIGSEHSAESLGFSDNNIANGWLGGFMVAIRPEPSQLAGCFNAQLEFHAASGDSATSTGMPIARRDRHIYHLAEFEKAGRATFRDLPVGDYEIIWPAKYEAPSEEHSLHAETDISKSSNHKTMPEPPWIVHPRDRRLLATVEPDSRGRAVITVESDDPELAGAKVQFRLWNETGEISLHKSAGACVSRGVRYLVQRYQAQPPTALNLTVISAG